MPQFPLRLKSVSRVQQLYRCSRSMFHPRRVPAVPQIKEALQLMAKIPLSELGFDENTFERLDRRTNLQTPMRQPSNVIEYLPVYEGADFHIGIFCLPRGAVIPLHDHPGMTVMSRLLYGKLQVRSFDLLHRTGGGLFGRQCQVRFSDEFIMQEGRHLTFLLPDKANLHMFKALTACAVLDVLAPPYSYKQGRECSYYSIDQPRERYEDADGFVKRDFVEAHPLMDARVCASSPEFVVKHGHYCGVLPDVKIAE